MKKFLLFTLIFLEKICLAQSGWNYLPNSPMSANRFDDLYFSNDSTGWAVNGEGQIYKTPDGGNSWTLQLDSPQYYFRSVEFINDSTGFAGTLSGQVFKTTDAGQSWNHIEQNFPQQVPGICGIGHWGNTVILVGKWSSPAFILRSTDAGVTWSYTSMSSFASKMVECLFISADTVFVSGTGTQASGSHGAVFRSVDAGLSWSLVGTSTPVSAYCWKLQFTSSQIGYSSLSEDIGTQSHVMKTIDGGSTWTTLYVTNTNIDGEGIGFVNDSVGWTGGWSSGMYQTNDGGASWNYVNFGNNFNRFIFRSASLGYAAGQSIYKFSGLSTGTNQPPGKRSDFHSFEIVPNPVRKTAEMKLHVRKNTTLDFEIYDESGKLIRQFFKGEIIAGDYSFRLDAAELDAGIFYAVMRTNEHFLTKRFAVVHDE